MQAVRADIAALIPFAIEGAAAEWNGDQDVASAVTTLMSDANISQAYQRDSASADFILACICAWVASELCTTIPDPGRLLETPVKVPRGEAAAVFSLHARTIHADTTASIHARSLAGVFVSFLEFSGSMRAAWEWVAPFRAALHAGCPDVPMQPLPRRLNGVPSWAYRVFYERKGCRHRVLRQALDANNSAKPGRFDERFSALARVGWEFGYRDAWAARGDSATMRTVVANAVYEGGRELYRRLTWQDVDLAWYGRRPPRLSAFASQRALQDAIGRAGVGKERLPRLWGEVLQYNCEGLLAGLGISLTEVPDAESRAIGETLKNLAFETLAERPSTVSRQALSKTHRGHFVTRLYGSVPWLFALSAIVAGFAFLGLPEWAASWIVTLATVLALSRSRRRSVFTGTIPWAQAVPLGVLLSSFLALTPLVTSWIWGAVWTPADIALVATSAALSAAGATLVVAGPYVTYKLGPAAWLLEGWGLPDEVAEAFDEAVVSLSRHRRP